jgi:hypothetical protein
MGNASLYQRLVGLHEPFQAIAAVLRSYNHSSEQAQRTKFVQVAKATKTLSIIIH